MSTAVAAPRRPTAVAVGDTVRLGVTTGAYARYKGLTGEVTVLHLDPPVHRATVHFDDGSEAGIIAQDVILNYLVRVETGPKKRRSPLNLTAPRDSRSEADKMAEAVAWLRERGYVVFEVGQFRQQAICHKCSRDAHRAVLAFCSTCHSKVFSPGTGSTPGTPDTYVLHPQRWPRAERVPPAHLPMEWKQAEKSERKPEQKALEAAGLIAVVWSLSTCLTAVYRYEDEVLHIEPHPEIVAWLVERGELLKGTENHDGF